MTGRKQLKTVYSVALALALGMLLSTASALAQSSPGMTYDTKEHILEDAKKEGRLVVSPGFEETTTPHLINAFKKRHPFVKEVIWSKPADFRKQFFDLVEGKIVLDVFRPTPELWGEYLKHDLFRKYDFRRMARDGHLNIPEQMIDASGVVVWSGSLIGILVYNAARLGSEHPPTGWESCLDPKWTGKFTVDTKPNVLASLASRWGEEKLLDFARKLKENNPVMVRGSTQGLAKLAAGEFAFMCGVYLHATERLLAKNPDLRLTRVIPDPLPVAYHEPEAVYARSQNRHVALLWIEFLASSEGQAVLDAIDPGRASFLVKGTLAHSLANRVNLSVCGSGCRDREDNLMKRIVVDTWRLPQDR